MGFQYGLQAYATFSFKLATLVRGYKEKIVDALDMFVDLTQCFRRYKIQENLVASTLYLIDVILERLQRQGWSFC